MKVGDLIRDFEFPQDHGIIVAIDAGKGAKVFCINNGNIGWLPIYYIQKCEVISAVSSR